MTHEEILALIPKGYRASISDGMLHIPAPEYLGIVLKDTTEFSEKEWGISIRTGTVSITLYKNTIQQHIVILWRTSFNFEGERLTTKARRSHMPDGAKRSYELASYGVSIPSSDRTRGERMRWEAGEINRALGCCRRFDSFRPTKHKTKNTHHEQRRTYWIIHFIFNCGLLNLHFNFFK